MRFFWLKKLNPRRSQVRKSIAAERAARRKRFLSPDVVNSSLLWLLFVSLAIVIIAVGLGSKIQALATAFVVTAVSLAAALYIHHYQRRVIKNHARAIALLILFLFLLLITKIGSNAHLAFATGTAAIVAIIMVIAYNQRFAIGISTFYCLLAACAVGQEYQFRALVTMCAASYTCCMSLKEIRTRDKLLQVGIIGAFVVFVVSLAMNFLPPEPDYLKALGEAGLQGLSLPVICIIIQGLLPYIEKAFRIATSMTLLDYSDANQPLLKRLAMEAPGTFSHCLMVGSIAEAAAESIGRNGLLCRVGAYYHDIGKIAKPNYFVENQVGSNSKHDDLSPAMSQLIIAGHVKDGKEIAKEYKLPSIIRQFIETHHGTTLIEYFYNEAVKKSNDKQQPPPSETEFRYEGPRPSTKEAAIVMLADAIESAVRALQDITPARIEAVVKNVAAKRLQDGQFDNCDMTFRELAQVEASMVKTLSAHYHGRIAYPEKVDEPPKTEESAEQK